MKLKRGEISSAQEQTDRALLRYPSEQTEWHWRFRVTKAEALARKGLVNESLELLRMEPPASLATADLAVRRKLVLGVASARVQQAANGARFVAEAEDLARAIHPELLAEVLSAKAVVDYLAGDISGAESAYREALQVSKEQRDPFVEAAALGGLGLIATKREHYDESIDLDLAAVRLAESVGAQNTLATVFGNIAWCYKKLGDFENALEFYQRAEEVSARSGQFGLQTYWYTGLSNVYFDQHDYRSAEAVLTQALELARSRGDKRTLVEYLNALSEIALQTGRIDVAERYIGEASEIEKLGGGQAGLDQSGVLGSTLIRARIDEAKHNYATAEESLRELVVNPAADASQHWEAHEQLAKIYLDLKLTAEAERQFRSGLETIETARSSVRAEDLRVTFLSGAIAFYDDYVDFLVSQHRIDEALQVADISRARTLEEGLASTSQRAPSTWRRVRPQQIAQKLKASLLFYWIGQNTSCLWVITPAKISYFDLPKASEIEPLVKSYRKTVLGMRGTQDAGRTDGEKLYAMLVEPAKKLIPPGSRVIVLPDASLYGLNFETLIVPDPQPHFWIEDVTLTTASSLTLLSASVMQPATKGKSLLLVGNTEPPNTEFPRLAQAPAEMEKIGNHFPDQERKVLEGKAATATAYLSSNPERYSYLHFVTHGTASRMRPLESAVILSPEGDSYKLYARDIVQHRLNANLVTISACNGSGTRTYSGEGLVGLSWAFLHAGAHNVIGALWEVSDASTPQLMDALYGELSRGKDPATALREAKLSLLHSSDPNSVFKKPFYWAPFQLYAGS